MPGTITDESPSSTSSQIEAIAKSLAREIGAEKYRIWFDGSAQLSLEKGCLQVGVANAFTARWIKSHFASNIERAAESVLGRCPRVTFSVLAELTARRPAKIDKRDSAALNASPTPAVRGGVAPQNSRRALRLHLDTFVVGPSNELAYNAAQIAVREQDSPFNPLFIHGGYGVGKTHLLQGICNAVSQCRPETNWLYLSAEDFANQFILGLKTRKLEQFRRRMRQTDLLAIDDIHFLSNKPSTQEEFLHTFNSINLAGKQVVLVSDASPKMIGQLSEKLVNRFVSGMVVKIDAPDFATRCKICEQCARTMIPTAFKAKLAAGSKAPEVSPDVVHYIAHSVRTNIRELEGALLKVIAFAALQGKRMTLTMAKHVLAEHVERCDPMVHLSDIETAVAQFFGTSQAHIHSNKKDKTVSIARHFSMFLARKHTKMSSSEVGRLMGNKNHATVLVACKKVEDLIKRDADVHWRSAAGNKVARAREVIKGLESCISR